MCVDEKRCLPCQQTKDAVAIKPSAATTSPRGEPEGTQDVKEQDTGPRQLRCISEE